MLSSFQLSVMDVLILSIAVNRPVMGRFKNHLASSGGGGGGTEGGGRGGGPSTSSGSVGGGRRDSSNGHGESGRNPASRSKGHRDSTNGSSSGVLKNACFDFFSPSESGYISTLISLISENFSFGI